RGMAPFLASATTVAQNSAPRFDNRDIAREHHAVRCSMERYPAPDGYDASLFGEQHELSVGLPNDYYAQSSVRDDSRWFRTGRAGADV
ncbi:MAG TPA: hypothetical protein VIK01_02935, partial [Polyangiaceae bacterium]